MIEPIENIKVVDNKLVVEESPTTSNLIFKEIWDKKEQLLKDQSC